LVPGVRPPQHRQHRWAPAAPTRCAAAAHRLRPALVEVLAAYS